MSLNHVTAGDGSDVRPTDWVRVGNGYGLWLVVSIDDDGTLHMTESVSGRNRKARPVEVVMSIEGEQASAERVAELPVSPVKRSLR